MATYYGEKLTFPQADLDLLGQSLKVIYDGLARQYCDMFDKIAECWKRYDAKPHTERKNEPYEGSSNLVIPTIRIHSDATIARYMTVIFASDKVWGGYSENEDFVESGTVREVPRFLNWSARNEIHLEEPMTENIQSAVVAGCGILRLGWEEKYANVVVPNRGETSAKRLTPVRVRTKRGPFVECLPRDRCLWDTNYHAWDAPFFAYTSYLSWSDLIIAVEEQGFDSAAVEGIRHQTFNPQRDKVGSQIRKDSDVADQPPEDYEDYAIAEVWVDWPIAKRSLKTSGPKEMETGDQLTTIVVYMHADSGTVLKVCAKPYAIPDKPFYDSYYKKRHGQANGDGLGEHLYHLQAGQSAIVNQSIDVVNISNSLPAVTNDRKLSQKRIQLGRPLYTPDVDGFRPMSLSKLIYPDVALFNLLNVVAERESGISDPALGRETRMGGHPAPATSTLALLGEGKKLDIIAMRSIRQAISKLGLDLATLYQQLETNEDGKIQRAVGSTDAKVVEEWIFPMDAPIIGNLELDLAAVSNTMNPEVEQSKALLSFQATSNYFALIQQHLAIAENPQTPNGLRAISLKAMEALGKSYETILETNDVDQLESYNFNFAQLAQAVMQEQQQIKQRLAAQGGPPSGTQDNSGNPGGGNSSGQGGVSVGSVGQPTDGPRVPSGSPPIPSA
jgi:hypothetical protein